MSSVTNLAKNLTDTTRAHAGRVAVRVDNAAMTYRALDEYTEEKTVHVDLSGRLDRRAYPLLLSTPPA